MSDTAYKRISGVKVHSIVPGTGRVELAVCKGVLFAIRDGIAYQYCDTQWREIKLNERHRTYHTRQRVW